MKLSTMVNPENNNKLIFRAMLLVFLAVVCFAVWLMYTATVRLK